MYKNDTFYIINDTKPLEGCPKMNKNDIIKIDLIPEDNIIKFTNENQKVEEELHFDFDKYQDLYPMIYLKNSGDVTIKVHNSIGKEVMASNLKNQSFGRSITQINTSELPSGLYTISLITENERIVKKMQVLK